MTRGLVVELLQQTTDCSDFDVITESTRPAFRVLLPETISARGLHLDGPLHVLPGQWRRSCEGVLGSFRAGDDLEVGVELSLTDDALLITLGVGNLGEKGLVDVEADVCAGVNHLPGRPGWSNRMFIPDVPLDRAVQGRYWYESVTPKGLKALVGTKWRTIHPYPRNPDADLVPPYFFYPSRRQDVKACACIAPEGDVVFFQSWSVPARYLAPFPGNACMHMRPLMAKHLEAKSSARVAGIVGMHRGNLSSLDDRLRTWLEG